jgi:hypothetical protein
LGPLVLQRSMNIAYSLFMGMVDERVIYCWDCLGNRKGFHRFTFREHNCIYV